jgi:hypothetical protein
MAQARQPWIQRSADTFLDELQQLGLVAPRDRVVVVIRDRLTAVATVMGITEPSARVYVTDEILRDLARELAVGLAGEQPGANLIKEARNIPTPLGTFGRTIAALAEAALVRQRTDDVVGLEGALQAISLLGQFLSTRPLATDDFVPIPQAALSRSARVLEVTAALIRMGHAGALSVPAESAGELADAFDRDANVLRGLVSEHGFAEGPFTAS